MTPSPTHGRVFWRLASAGALLLAMLAAIVGPAPQRALAEELTTLVHGREAFVGAERASRAMFGQDDLREVHI